jgi:hypothetical protein
LPRLDSLIMTKGETTIHHVFLRQPFSRSHAANPLAEGFTESFESRVTQARRTLRAHVMGYHG